DVEADGGTVPRVEVPFRRAVIGVPERVERQGYLGLPAGQAFLGVELLAHTLQQLGGRLDEVARALPRDAAELEELGVDRVELPDLVRADGDLRVVLPVAARSQRRAGRAIVQGIDIELH